MANAYEVPSHLEIDILRPDGTVETVTHPKYKQWLPKDFAAFNAAMKQADAASERVQQYLNKTA